MKFNFKKLSNLKSFLLLFETIFIFTIVFSPVNGVILPVGEEVCEAYDMLSSTEVGKDLIKRVKKASRGNYIYITLGDTENQNLIDYSGREVRGLTRVIRGYGAVNHHIFNTAVITNRDVTGNDPIEILKNISFELENIVHIYNNPYVEPPKDSPQSHLTQAAVLSELFN